VTEAKGLFAVGRGRAAGRERLEARVEALVRRLAEMEEKEEERRIVDGGRLCMERKSISLK
jgi:hypothetical protein